MQPLDRPWFCLESIPGLCTVRSDWEGRLGHEFPLVERFLCPTDKHAGSYPCPSPGGEGCPRRVVVHGSADIVAVCGDSPQRCETLQLSKQDVVLYRFDVEGFSAELAELLEIEPRFEEVGGAPHTWAVGVRTPAVGEDFLVYLALPQSPEDLRQAASRLVATNAETFLLLAPTEEKRDLTTRELLRSHGAHFDTLKDFVAADDAGNLSGAKSPAEVFAGLEPGPGDDEANLFKRSGKVWKIRYQGEEEILLPHMVGLQYLAVLLREPKRKFHVTDLAAATGEAPASTPGTTSARKLGEELPSDGLDAAGERLDSKARAAYKKRLQEIEPELEQAEENRDLATAKRLRKDQKFIEDELRSASGLHDRSRRTDDPVKRKQDQVRNAINRALDKIRKRHPALAHHLDGAIRRGRDWSYHPEPPVSWIA